MRQFILVLIGLFLSAMPTLAQDGYRIKSGDVLRIEVLEDPNLNRSMLVLPDGRISMPLAGSVAAAGQTIEQVQAKLADQLAPNFAARPTVFIGIDSLAVPVPVAGGVSGPAVIDVYMMGEAASPGKYQVTPGTTLLQFIAQSGGFSKFAATKRIQLRRTDRSGAGQVYTFNYKALEGGAATGVNTVMSNGDVIIVPQRRLFE